jgi:hypothetical protein
MRSPRRRLARQVLKRWASAGWPARSPRGTNVVVLFVVIAAHRSRTAPPSYARLPKLHEPTRNQVSTPRILTPMRDFVKVRAKIVHPYEWLWEPFESETSFVLRAMFGAKAAYLDGRLVLCFMAKAEPWRGVLICTDKSHHESLRDEFPALAPHSVLPKWLYLPEAADGFERDAERIVGLTLRRDARIGVLAKSKKTKSRPGAKAKSSSPGRYL